MKILRLSIKFFLVAFFLIVTNAFALVYTVKPGDSLDKIAKKYGVSVKALIKENHLKKPYIIRPGQKLKIPTTGRRKFTGYIKYKVKRGDTLSEIAQKFGVSVKEIARLNHLKKPYRLRAGQILKIPKKYSKTAKSSKIEAYRIYRVRKGDSLIKIAKKFGVSTKDIIKANNLKRPYHLRAGQRLKIPIKYASKSYKPRKTSSRKDYSYSYCSRKYRVKPGDTLSEIAQKFGTSTKTLKRINGLRSSTLRVGQILCVRKVTKRVYRGSSGKVVKIKYIRYKVKPGDSLIKIAKKFHVYTKDIIRANHLKKPYRLRVGQVLKIPKKVVTYIRKPPKEEETFYAGSLKSGFIWPVDGEVINPFVNNALIRHLGIDIQSDCGATVRASKSGVVIFAGQGIKPYGKMVIIRHRGTFTSLYGHLSNILVHEYQRVRKGQPIGTVGELNEGVCGIYFEIRKNTKPVDPLVFLSKDK